MHSLTFTFRLSVTVGGTWQKLPPAGFHLRKLTTEQWSRNWSPGFTFSGKCSIVTAESVGSIFNGPGQQGGWPGSRWSGAFSRGRLPLTQPHHSNERSTFVRPHRSRQPSPRTRFRFRTHLRSRESMIRDLSVLPRGLVRRQHHDLKCFVGEAVITAPQDPFPIQHFDRIRA